MTSLGVRNVLKISYRLINEVLIILDNFLPLQVSFEINWAKPKVNSFDSISFKERMLLSKVVIGNAHEAV